MRTAGAQGVKEGGGSGGGSGEVSGVIHFYYHAAPAGGRGGKLFLKQSGGSHQSYYLPVAEGGAQPTEGDSERPAPAER